MDPRNANTQGNASGAPHSPIRRRVTAPQNFNIAFPSMPATPAVNPVLASLQNENKSKTQSPTYHIPGSYVDSPETPSKSAAATLRDRQLSEEKDRETLRKLLRGSFSPTNSKETSSQVSPFTNGYQPNLYPEAPAQPGQATSIPGYTKITPTFISPKYSPFLAKPVSKPEPNFVSPTDPVALGRLPLGQPLGGLKPVAVNDPIFRPSAAALYRMANSSNVPSQPLQHYKMVDSMPVVERPPVQKPYVSGLKPEFAPSKEPVVKPKILRLANLESGDKPQVPQKETIAMRLMGSSKPTIAPQQSGFSATPAPIISSTSHQECEDVEMKDASPEATNATWRPRLLDIAAKPRRSFFNPRDFLPRPPTYFMPVSAPSTAHPNRPKRKRHFPRLRRNNNNSPWANAKPFASLGLSHEESDGDIIMQDDPATPSLKRGIDEVADPMQNEIEAGRSIAPPIVDLEMLDADSPEALTECVCELRRSERSEPQDNGDDFAIPKMPGSWPSPQPNREISQGAIEEMCPRCRPGITPQNPSSYGSIPLGFPCFSLEKIFAKLCLADPVLTSRTIDNTQSSSSFASSPIRTRSERTWIFNTMRILGTVKRRVIGLCKAPARKFMTWCDYRAKQRQEQREQRRRKRQSRIPAASVQPVSPPTVPSPIKPPTVVSSHRRSRLSSPMRRPFRADTKAKDPLRGILRGRVTKGDAIWTDRPVKRTGSDSRCLSSNQAHVKKSSGLPRVDKAQMQDFETGVVAWITQSSRPDLPPPPKTHEESQGLTSLGEASESDPAEPVRDGQPSRIPARGVRWLESSTPQKRPISSVKIFNPNDPVVTTVPAEEGGQKSSSMKPTRISQGPIIRPLPAKWELKVESALSNPDSRQLGTTIGGDALTRRDFATCATPLAWLNDEIINAYLAIIVDYARRSSGNSGRQQQPMYHAFSTFFYSSLRDKGYESVRRWALRAKIGGPGLLRVESVFVPIHHHDHWTLMVVKPADRTIQHFDSLSGSASFHVAKIKEWLQGELKELFVSQEWRVLPSKSPCQDNGSDCGVFLLTTAKLVALQLPLLYGPRDIPAIRRRIVAELMNGGLEGDFDPEVEYAVKSLL